MAEGTPAVGGRIPCRWLRRPWLALALALTTVVAGHARPASASPVIFASGSLGSKTLRVSRYRHLGLFNAALFAALDRCGRPAPAAVVAAPGLLSPRTVSAIRVLRTCPGWAIAGEEGSGDITEELWHRLLPAISAPDAFARIFVATLTLEGTDYDHLEWNFSKVDPEAWATWGPFGATMGQNGEIQQILTRVGYGPGSVVERAFAEAAAFATPVAAKSSAWGRGRFCADVPDAPADDYALLVKVMPLRKAAAGRLLRAAFCDDRRFAVWVRAFRLLGDVPAVRRAYDEAYFAPDRKVSRYISHTLAAYSAAGATATELDVAMGVDGQTQYSPRANETKVAAAVRSARRSATPADSRRAISAALVPPGHERDRCGRDAVFFRGTRPARPIAACSGDGWDLEAAWRGRSNFIGEQLGLRDVDGSGIRAGWNYDFDQ